MAKEGIVMAYKQKKTKKDDQVAQNSKGFSLNAVKGED